MMNTLKKMAVSAVAALAGMMMVAPTAMANSGTIPIDAAHFPDTTFRVYIADHVDINRDGRLSVAERNATTELTPSYNSSYTITSAKGIEYFPNLTKLYISSQKLAQIDLRGNPKLKELYIGFNQLTRLDVSHNTQLTELDADMNKLSSLDVSHNTKLQELSFCGNPLRWISKVPSAVRLDSGRDTTDYYPVNGGVLNLKQAAPNIDLHHISNLDNAKLENGMIMPIDRTMGAQYLYTYDYIHEPIKVQLNFTPSVWFTDVQANSTPHAVDIQWLADNKITTGWLVNGRYVFRGMDNVKRQDMAAFLKRLAAKANKGQNIRGKAFADVNRSTPHWQEIQWLGGSGISTGWPSNRGPVFRGMDTVKRQDMAAFIHRLNNLLG